LRLTSLADIRARLETDRVWAAFSLADLDEPYAAHARWFGPESGRGLLLVYSAFDPPIVYVQGSEADVRLLLSDEAVRGGTGRAWLNVRLMDRPAVDAAFASFDARRMVRMVLGPSVLAPPPPAPTERLTISELEEVEALYADDRPAFFVPEQLTHGVYYGVRAAGRLVSVAGTHVLSETCGVGAIGNVYTHPGHRGQGLAGAATHAVVRELDRRGIRTIVLNIIEGNEPARRVYERLGFCEYCIYEEGLAVR